VIDILEIAARLKFEAMSRLYDSMAVAGPECESRAARVAVLAADIDLDRVFNFIGALGTPEK
jgi:hypothetical protein